MDCLPAAACSTVSSGRVKCGTSPTGDRSSMSMSSTRRVKPRGETIIRKRERFSHELTLAYPSRCTRIRQNALPANQQPSSKQVWPSRDVQRHRGTLHPRGVARRSEPSIDPESLLHDHDLQALSSQVGIAELGQSASFNHATTRPRE